MVDHSQYSDKTLTGRVTPDKAAINKKYLLLHPPELIPRATQSADYSWKVSSVFYENNISG